MSKSAPGRQLVIYTDLDGTLLDAQTYAWDAARPALQEIRCRRLLLVLNSSKTRAEMEPLLEELGLHAPFVVENGGAIYLPREEFAAVAPEAEPCGAWMRLSLGAPYAHLLACLTDLKRRAGVLLVGWSDLTPEEIARECGLSLDQARRAKQREYDEPFRVMGEDPTSLDRIEAIVAEHGLRLVRGGRYFHLTGRTNKGRAVRTLDEILRRRFGPIFTVGIGDSENDIPMLRAVALPFLVRRPNGEPDPVALRLVPHVRITRGAGPIGWSEAIARVLAQLEEP